MTRLDRILKLLEEYDDLAACHFESKEYLVGHDILMRLREEKQTITQELIEHGCERSIDVISQDIFSEKPKMKKETWSGGGFGI